MIPSSLDETLVPAVRWLRTTSRLALALGGTATAGGALLFEARWRGVHDSHRASRVRLWAIQLLRTLGVRVHRDSETPHPSALERTLVVANHRSLLDIPVILSVTGGHMLSRGDVAGWPGFGSIAETAGTVFVDRDDPNSGAMAVQRMRELLHRGCTVCVFPEGTTFAGDAVRPFHKGAFVAAARARGSVVAPIGIAYADDNAIYGDETLWNHVARIAATRQIRVAVAIGERFSSRGLGVRELASRAEHEVQRLVHRARHLLG